MEQTSDKSWGSHLPVLMKIMSLTTGNVLEIGTGIYSTPFLHWACFSQGRSLVSVEESDTWIEFPKKFESDFHKVEKQIPNDVKFDVVFIDSFPLEDRRAIAEKMAHRSNYVVVHDIHPGEYADIFKYCSSYTKAEPNTLVFSNFMDLNNLWQ